MIDPTPRITDAEFTVITGPTAAPLKIEGPRPAASAQPQLSDSFIWRQRHIIYAAGLSLALVTVHQQEAEQRKAQQSLTELRQRDAARVAQLLSPAPDPDRETWALYELLKPSR